MFYSCGFITTDLLCWNSIWLLQIVEKLVDIVTYINQAIYELLGNHGMRFYLLRIQINVVPYIARRYASLFALGA